MSERPALEKGLNSGTFREYYYLKEELTAFCRENGLSTFGSKAELTERIACYLDTGKAPESPARTAGRSRAPDVITADSVIEEGFVCSEKHRAFFKKELGDGFSFNVPFQKWLKANAGKTYGDAIEAYRVLKKEKKASPPPIDRQFEYNTYIRDFFADNSGKTLDDAIKCWKYKKGLKGHNRYERSDLSALKQ